jgi:hypothetical protein
VSVRIKILAHRVPSGSCLLAQGDSTSMAGWLRKSNFAEHSHPLQLETARHLACILVDAGVLLYSQCFPGKAYGFSDILSRDSHLSDSELTCLCRSSIPLQIPLNLDICPLPPAIYFWVISLLRSQPLIKESSKEPTRSSTWLGHAGQDGSKLSNLFDDAYLEAIQPRTRTRLLGAFAAAIRYARFSGTAYCQLAAGTVSDTVNHVASTFVDAGFADPRKHGDGASSRFLQRQYKCYRNLDADVKQQKVITASILVNMFDHAQTAGGKAAAELAIGTFFFAMWSCEYSHVDGVCRTKLLRLRNIRFIKENRTLPLSDPRLTSADAVTITFEFQNTDVRSETVHQHATHLPVLCPMLRWAKIMQQVLSYPGGDPDCLVSTVVTHDRRRLVTSKFVANQLWAAAASRIGKDVLGPPH